jgi:hypothetical protein
MQKREGTATQELPCSPCAEMPHTPFLTIALRSLGLSCIKERRINIFQKWGIFDKVSGLNSEKLKVERSDKVANRCRSSNRLTYSYLEKQFVPGLT